MRYSSSAHTRFYHRFHVVWVTKYRHKVLQGAIRVIAFDSQSGQAMENAP